ncbi:hypothetical protein LTR37_005330 [Vermiconidia calcicola]|uniref:Uncharacterized protein n=1 Tax=Vermiconidia calcicola TaxID=1690605 RepID=A0ACC3NK33_9PEZI|nr:hypothetical protein LTR37_005330 [Vermiconidia calcicola]
MPFSSFFANRHAHPTLRIPLNSFFLVVTVIALLSFIQISSTTAFNALLSLLTLALYISYVVPITLHGHQTSARQAHTILSFRLEKFGLPINVFGVVYAVYVIMFLPFPPTLPVTAVNVNYAGPVLGAVLVFALVEWCVNGRRRWTGPGSTKDVT